MLINGTQVVLISPERGTEWFEDWLQQEEPRAGQDDWHSPSSGGRTEEEEENSPEEEQKLTQEIFSHLEMDHHLFRSSDSTQLSS
ncbi:hypothetical protein AOLI_G00131940 [Acnodon oligacanthus]